MNSNQIWCVSYWHVCNNTFLPWPLERSQTVKYLYILITKPISQICIPNLVCLRSIKRYKKYKKGFLFSRHGDAPGVGLGGARDQFCLSPPKQLDEIIQPNLVCELLTWNERAIAHFSSPLWALQRRQKVKYHLINYKTNFKDFITKLCLLTNKKLYKIWNAI